MTSCRLLKVNSLQEPVLVTNLTQAYFHSTNTIHNAHAVALLKPHIHYFLGYMMVFGLKIHCIKYGDTEA